MKISLKILMMSALLSLSVASHAVEPKQVPKEEAAGMEHDMGGMDHAGMAEHMKSKQEHMLMMHDLSNKILAEKDPKKQQELKDQQLELMKAHHMQMMSTHHGKPMEHGKSMDHGKTMDHKKMQ